MEEDLDMLNVKNDLLLVVVAFIILGLVIPEGGLLRDYATEYCNKDSSVELEALSDTTVEDQISFGIELDYPFYLNKDVGFFSCEIG